MMVKNSLLRYLQSIHFGRLTLELPDLTIHQFGNNGPEAFLKINNYKAISLIISKGNVGFAEGYIYNYWQTDNLLNLYHIFAGNLSSFSELLSKKSLGKYINIIKHFFNQNTKIGSKKNIHAHYDLGNNFFKEWLDETFTYSSAKFNSDAEELSSAQKNKYQSILDKLNLPSGSKILEIGCGWGGFIEHASEQGHQVVGLTISNEQLDYAKQRNAKYRDSKILFEDYRDHHGEYDAVVSIEMFEAVGSKYWQTFTDKIAALMKKNSSSVIQTITIRDELLDEYLSNADFIQTYIFPGGELISPNRFEDIAKKSSLTLSEIDDFGYDYAKTLEIWYQKFNQKWNSINKLGFDEKFKKIWDTYLAYCRGGFLTKRISVSQFVFKN